MIDAIKIKCKRIINKCIKELDNYEYSKKFNELEQSSIRDVIIYFESFNVDESFKYTEKTLKEIKESD